MHGYYGDTKMIDWIIIQCFDRASCQLIYVIKGTDDWQTCLLIFHLSRRMKPRLWILRDNVNIAKIRNLAISEGFRNTLYDTFPSSAQNLVIMQQDWKNLKKLVLESMTNRIQSTNEICLSRAMSSGLVQWEKNNIQYLW